jgi:hypothetical protein
MCSGVKVMMLESNLYHALFHDAFGVQSILVPCCDLRAHFLRVSY